MIEPRNVGASPRAVRAAVSAALNAGDPQTRTRATEMTRLQEIQQWPDGLLQSVKAHRPPVDDFVPHDDRRYAFDEFTRFHDRAFIVAAYRGLLGRRPDHIGLDHHLDLLRRGCSKVELLGRLRYSDEGKRYGALLPRLALRFALSIALELPIVGALLGTIELLVRGPSWRRHVRRLESHVHSLVDQQRDQLLELEQVTDRNLRLLEERIEVLRNR